MSDWPMPTKNAWVRIEQKQDSHLWEGTLSADASYALASLSQEQVLALDAAMEAAIITAEYMIGSVTGKAETPEHVMKLIQRKEGMKLLRTKVTEIIVSAQERHIEGVKGN